ncbi:MAG: hypothetical protein ABIR92_02525 [Gemmatimonadaceae bacterium]
MNIAPGEMALVKQQVCFDEQAAEHVDDPHPAAMLERSDCIGRRRYFSGKP